MDGIEQIRFAGTVVSNETIYTRPEFEADFFVIFEMNECQIPKKHVQNYALGQMPDKPNPLFYNQIIDKSGYRP
jgi:hypothetical protein